MGVTFSKESGFGADDTDLDDSVSVAAPAAAAAVGGPDAFNLNRSDFPTKIAPKVTGVRDARYQVVFKQSVLDEIHAHGKSSMEAEVCGVLIGDIYADRMAPWAYVEHSIRGNNAVGKQTQVTITSETWTRIHETLERDFPGKKIVGWYHTHPGFGIFLSGMDLFIQDNFFNQPWQVATVYDPHSGDEGTFIWRGGKSVREDVLVENDTGAVVSNGNAEKAIVELAKRVKSLERRLDWILTGFLFLVLIALVAPLILIAFAPDVLKKLPMLQHHNAPAATAPSTDAPASPPSSKPSSTDAGPAPRAAAAAAPVETAPPSAKPPARDSLLIPGGGVNEEVSRVGVKTLTPKTPAGR